MIVAPTTTERTVDLDGVAVPLRLAERRRERPFLLLHGGAGPASVRGFGDLLADRLRTRVLVPTHPGFDGTPHPPVVSGMRDLARLYVRLLDELDDGGTADVTVVGNSIGGWLAAEVGLLGSPRVGRVVVVNAVGLAVAGHPVADVRGLTPQELRRLSFHDPERFAPDPSAPGPSPELVQANSAALFSYGGPSMTDPTLGERLRGMPVPVHVVWGAADGVVTLEHARAWVDALPDARLTILPGAGHLPQIEAPERLLEVLQDRTG